MGANLNRRYKKQKVSAQTLSNHSHLSEVSQPIASSHSRSPPKLLFTERPNSITLVKCEEYKNSDPFTNRPQHYWSNMGLTGDTVSNIQHRSHKLLGWNIWETEFSHLVWIELSVTDQSTESQEMKKGKNDDIKQMDWRSWKIIVLLR